MNEQCEFPGHHYGEVLRVHPDKWSVFKKDKWICQGHLYYVCWDYTILIHVDALKREHTGILSMILKPYEEWMMKGVKR